MLARCLDVSASDGSGNARDQQKILGLDCLLPGRQRRRPDNQEQKRADSAGSLPGSQPVPSLDQVLRREVDVMTLDAPNAQHNQLH